MPACGEVDGLPVVGGADGLDAVVGGERVVQEADRGLPSRRAAADGSFELRMKL